MRRKKVVLSGIVFICVVIILAIVSVVGLSQALAGQILPQVSVGDTHVGGLTEKEAEQKVRNDLQTLMKSRIAVRLDGKIIAEPTIADLGVSPSIKAASSKAAKFGHPRPDVVWVGEFFSGMVYAPIKLNFLIYRPYFDKFVKENVAKHEQPPINAGWTFNVDGSLRLIEAKEGTLVDQEKFAKDLLERVRTKSLQPIELAFTKRTPEIGNEEALSVKNEVEKISATPFVLRAKEKEFVVPVKTARAWISIEKVNGEAIATFLRGAVNSYLLENVAAAVNKVPQDARFELAEDGRVTVFSAAQTGNELDVNKSTEVVRATAQKGENNVELVFTETEPKIKSTREIENLGIKTLLATGESDFRGSPRNRKHNIEVGTARFHGVLIPPGQVFAFNEHLGPVTKDTGYYPELVIKENVTRPEYGGGICQVSTTAFRAAVMAGLKITERSNHAYPVAYYGKPGFDATIYPNQRTWRDGTDLKFVNDTPGYILIQTKIDGTKLIFEFWGTSDGREVKVNGPVVYDKKPDGSLRARLVQQIFRNGALAAEHVILSSYKSPDLFPHVTAANAEKNVQNQTAPVGSTDPKPEAPKPTSTPKPAVKTQ